MNQKLEKLKLSTIEKYQNKIVYKSNKAYQLQHRATIKNRNISDFVSVAFAIEEDPYVIALSIFEIIKSVVENKEEFLSLSENKNIFSITKSILEASNLYLKKGEKKYDFCPDQTDRSYQRMIIKEGNKKIEMEVEKEKPIDFLKELRKNYISKIMDSDNFIKMNEAINQMLNIKETTSLDIKDFIRRYDSINSINKLNNEFIEELICFINKYNKLEKESIQSPSPMGVTLLMHIRFVFLNIIINENLITSENCSFSDLYKISNKLIGHNVIKKELLKKWSKFKEIKTEINIDDIIKKYSKIESKLVAKETFDFYHKKERDFTFKLFNQREKRFISSLEFKAKRLLLARKSANKDNKFKKEEIEEREFKIIKQSRLWTKAVCINVSGDDFVCKIKNEEGFNFKKGEMCKLEVIDKSQMVNGTDDFVFHLFTRESYQRPYVLQLNGYYNEHLTKSALELDAVWDNNTTSWVFPEKAEKEAERLEEVHMCDQIKIKATANQDLNFNLPMDKKDPKINILGTIIIAMKDGNPFMPSKVNSKMIIEEMVNEDKNSISILKGTEIIINTTKHLLNEHKDSINNSKYTLETMV